VKGEKAKGRSVARKIVEDDFLSTTNDGEIEIDFVENDIEDIPNTEIKLRMAEVSRKTNKKITTRLMSKLPGQ
jgi:hypothetical protein